MTNIPTTEAPLIIRTDFSDQSGWEELTATVQEPADPFVFNMEILDNRANDGLTAEQLLKAIPDDYPHSFIAVADQIAVSQSDNPLLIIDLVDERGREFRAQAAHVASIENNLSIGNMGFDEFASMVSKGGVFRGIRG